MAIIGIDIELAAEFLEAGETVAIPTETVYGLAANALDEEAVSKIFSVKNRPTYNPLIIHLGSKKVLDKYIAYVPAKAHKLMDVFWPGPLTFLLEKKPIIPDLVTASLPKVAVRMPRHELTETLLRLVDFPLAAPSANPFGYISPTLSEHVEKQIGDRIPYILEGGACQQGIESTIVDFAGDKVIVRRLGSITLDELEKVVGSVELDNKAAALPVGPGMLPYHYSPKTPLYLVESAEEFLKSEKHGAVGIISLQKTEYSAPHKELIALSKSGDIKEAAHKLYKALHDLDAKNLDAIIVERFKDDGLGQSLNDRLKKASFKASGKS